MSKWNNRSTHIFEVLYQLFQSWALENFLLLIQGVAMVGRLLHEMRRAVFWNKQLEEQRSHYVAQKIAHLYVNESLLWWRHFPMILPRVTFFNVWICRMWCNIKEELQSRMTFLKLQSVDYLLMILARKFKVVSRIWLHQFHCSVRRTLVITSFKVSDSWMVKGQNFLSEWLCH